METPRPKGEARRQAIIEAARAALLADSYHAMSLRKLAKGLGISVGNLQYHFPSKDDLMLAVIQRELDEGLALVGQVELYKDENAIDAKIQTAVFLLLQRFSGPTGRLYLMAGVLALDDARYAAILSAGYTLFFEAIGGIVADINPDLPPAEQKTVGRLIVALFDGAVLQIQSQPALQQADQLSAFSATLASTIMKIVRG